MSSIWPCLFCSRRKDLVRVFPQGKFFDMPSRSMGDGRLVFKSRGVLCSNQEMSCVRNKRCLVFKSEDFLCSNQETSCVQITRCRVFEPRDVLCSNQKISCVQIKTFRVFNSNYSWLHTPQFRDRKNSIRIFFCIFFFNVCCGERHADEKLSVGITRR